MIKSIDYVLWAVLCWIGAPPMTLVLFLHHLAKRHGKWPSPSAKKKDFSGAQVISRATKPPGPNHGYTGVVWEMTFPP